MNIYDTCLSSCRFPVQTAFFVSLMYILWYLSLQLQLLKVGMLYKTEKIECNDLQIS